MTKTKIKELSVFFPAYNEQANIENTVYKAKKILEKVAHKWEILIINDGSTDDTLKVSRQIAKTDIRIKVIDHSVNRGYGAALKSGLYNAKYDWIAFTDSDGQFDFSEIINFIETKDKTKADAIIGWYKKRKVSKVKIVTSKMWEHMVNFLFGLKIKDIDCGFKLLSKNMIDALPKLESERGAFISSELLIKAKKKGYKIVEIPVTHYPRLDGQGTGRNLDVILESFKDLFSLWNKLR